MVNYRQLVIRWIVNMSKTTIFAKLIQNMPKQNEFLPVVNEFVRGMNAKKMSCIE